jgi:hypothetical protein
MVIREKTKVYSFRDAVFAWLALIVLLFMVRCFIVDVAAML